ncbi:SDR family NAD(P)-dependent oxidoreductase [Streptomyces sp. NPDC087856]|uniref:SDR family NAD(P)-dependent oxidoreductase n=1 Tax=Streptomyces sp. NPDC087856 TaxID=3365811 RepID=UPI0037FFA14C
MKTAVVTGATSGIGLELSRRLLREGWSVAAVGRHSLPSSSDFASAQAGGRLREYRCDLADASDRSRVVADLAAAEPTIDALFNNAGVSTGVMEFSPQGRELHYEVNCVAPYVLADGLASCLATGGRGVIVNTVSDALFYAKRYDPEALSHPDQFKLLTGPYASAKLALALWSKALAPRLSAQGTAIFSLSPGPINTPLIRGPGFPAFMRPLAVLLAKPPSYGAGLLLEVAEGGHPSGSLVMKRKVKALPFIDRAQRTLEVVAADALLQ